MSLHLYDTATRSLRHFLPIEPNHATVYVCGATVQGPPHIGHVRSGVAFDVLGRWLQATGTKVTLCRNVTDIDDKILAKAILEDRPWWAVAAAYERAFADAYDTLGCMRPTVEPRATGHIPEMIELIATLIEAGHAYTVTGDVYFSVASFPRYGQLSGQRPQDMLSAAGETDKRDPRDFALWKRAKPDEPAWATPWGRGRPGWHIECTAMATAYLGAEFDIHGGGRDLEFPHHENEIAQAQGAGYGFAHYWLHNGWVTTAGEKMSKSLGNSLLVSEVVQRVRPVELRWYLAAAHYRSTLEYSEQALLESAAGYRRLEGFVQRAHQVHPDVTPSPVLPPAFVNAMNDDLNVPAAVAVLHETVTAGNTALAAGDARRTAELLADARAMLAVLGADPLASQWLGAGSNTRAHLALDTLVQTMMAERETARRSRDFTAADTLRDRLRQAGVVIEDTPDGPRWELATENS